MDATRRRVRVRSGAGTGRPAPLLSAVAPVLLVLATCSVSSSGAVAQEPEVEAVEGDAETKGWDDLVRDLSANRSIRVEMHDGAVRLGRSVAVDDTSLTLRIRSGPDPTRIPRPEIASVAVGSGNRQGLGALVGAVVVGGITAALLTGHDGAFSLSGEFGGLGLTLVLGAAGTGAVVGTLVGQSVPRYEEYDVGR